MVRSSKRVVAEALRCRAQPSAASVCPRSAADDLIRSAVDIFHPRQQGNTAADMPAASGLVRSIDILGSVNINGRVLD